MDQPETLEHQGKQASLDHKESPEVQVPSEWTEEWVQPDQSACAENREPRAPRVRRDPRDHLDPTAMREPPEARANAENKAPKEPRVMRERAVCSERLEDLVDQESSETEEPLGFRDQSASREASASLEASAGKETLETPAQRASRAREGPEESGETQENWVPQAKKVLKETRGMMDYPGRKAHPVLLVSQEVWDRWEQMEPRDRGECRVEKDQVEATGRKERREKTANRE